MHPANCLNCGSNLDPGQKFCAVCGQKAATHKLNLHEIGHEALHYFIHADKSILHLIRELALRPGKVAREFIAGRRVKYFKPVNFFLIVAGILVFMTSYFHFANDTALKRFQQVVAGAKDPVQRKRLSGQLERMEKAIHFMEKYSNVVTMLLTPLFAFILWQFYKKAGYSFIEHLVANMYFSSFTMLCYALILVPWQKQLVMNITGWIMLLVFIIFQIVYGSIAYYQFINRRGTVPYLKALGVYSFTILLWAVGSSSLVNWYIKSGFR